jgi:hypothetical protein
MQGMPASAATERSRAVLVLVLATGVARAQPVTHTEDAPQLAELRDDKQLAEALSAITQDPAIHVDDPRARSDAQALMTEGVHQLQTRAYDQALANFLEAYAKFPSPKILLDIASALRDIGRLADAANTYARYLAEPAATTTRVGEVKQLLADLDKQLTVLAVHVVARGCMVSIDGGPFVSVGRTLITRVRPGVHLVRGKQGGATSEVTINGFEGEQRDVPVDVTPTAPSAGTAAAQDSTAASGPPVETADRVDGWLITGTQYDVEGGANGRTRRVRIGYAGPDVAPILPAETPEASAQVATTAEPDTHIPAGVVALARIVPYGGGAGAAGGLGITYAPIERFELELEVLRSQAWGGYFGARYRLLRGDLRPYVAAGVPLFEFVDTSTSSSTVVLGVRGAAGVEYKLFGHIWLEADLGVEHYFDLDNKLYMDKSPSATLFVPTVGVIGRM